METAQPAGNEGDLPAFLKAKLSRIVGASDRTPPETRIPAFRAKEFMNIRDHNPIECFPSQQQQAATHQHLNPGRHFHAGQQAVREMELTYLSVVLVTLVAMSASARRGSFHWQSITPTTKPAAKPATAPAKPPLCESQCCTCSNNFTEVQCTSKATCQDFTISLANNATRLHKEVKTVKLSKFMRLKILRYSFSSTVDKLRMIIIDNVNELEIESNSFARSTSPRAPKEQISRSPSLHKRTTLDISNTRIRNLPKDSVSGEGFEKITITNSFIGTIESAAFSTLPNLHSLTISGTNITTIETAAFNNSKVEILKLERNVIDDIQDLAFNIATTEAVVSQNVINNIKTESFNLSSPNAFRLSHNVVNNVYRHAFQFKSLKVEIMNNTFRQLLDHAFHYIQPANNQSPPLYFTDNIIEEFNNEALFFHDIKPTFHVNFLHINLGFKCNCTLRRRLDSLFQDARPRIIDDIGTIADHILDATYCSVDRKQYEKFQDYETASCSSTVNLASILIPLFLAIVVLSVLVYFWKRIRERMDQANKRSWVIAVPQTVYKENEIRIVEEFALPIEELPEWQVSHEDIPEQVKTAKTPD